MPETMSRFARSIRIETSVADVWAAIVDVEAWPAWASQFRLLDRLDTSPLAVGSRVRVTPKGMPGAVWEVTECEEGLSFTWASSLLPGVRVTGGHAVAADGNGTTAEFWLEASGALGRLLAPWLRRTVFSRNTTGATGGLKSYLEGPLDRVRCDQASRRRNRRGGTIALQSQNGRSNRETHRGMVADANLVRLSAIRALC